MPDDFIIEDALVGIFIQDKENNEVYMAGTVELTNNTGIVSEVENTVCIYPNPAFETINLSSEDVIHEISIINVAGAILNTYNCNSNNLKIDISEYHSGYYIVTVNTNKGKAVYPLIVK